MKLNDYMYKLSPDKIAQFPISPRDSSKLLIYNNNKIEDKKFSDLSNIVPRNSILILNNTKVTPARSFAHKKTGGIVEVLFIKSVNNYNWLCFVKPLKRIKNNTTLYFKLAGLEGKLVKKNEDGSAILSFNQNSQYLQENFKLFCELALPPYIKQKLENDDNYQTCYAKNYGSIAAPTAGLHFTTKLINRLKNKGVTFEYIDLKVGPGTFLPVKEKNINNHKMHSEEICISKITADRINSYKSENRPIYTVGTTTCRVLESVSDDNGKLHEFSGMTNIFIKPGYKFKFVDNLFTNFHLPGSTLLMLVSTLIGYKETMQIYNHAINNNYRFYSFGDSMLIKLKDERMKGTMNRN